MQNWPAWVKVVLALMVVLCVLSLVMKAIAGVLTTVIAALAVVIGYQLMVSKNKR